MAGFTFQLGSGKSGSKAGSFASRLFLCLFATPFAAFGLFAIWGGIQKLQAGSQDGIFIGLFGLVFAGMGFGLMYAAITAAPRQAAVEEKYRAQTDGGTKPWLARADWAAGKIKSSGMPGQNFFWIWSLLALAMSAPAVLAIPKEWQKGNHAILLALLFPAVAFYLIGYSIAYWRSRRRFGDCFFELAQIPAPLGGTLAGLIQTGTRVRLEHGLHLKLSCIRRTVSGSGKNRSVNENILWQDEKVLKPDADLPEPEPGCSGIPVFFKLPAGQPQSFSAGDSAVIWRLEARAKMSGPDFAATFEVPVFTVAGAAVADADEPDPTVALQMPVEEIRRDENSKIKITDSPCGREFYFPAARNPGTAVMVTVFWIVWSGFLWLMIAKHAPILFPIVFGLFDILIFWGCLMAWFKSSRVTVNDSGVTLNNRFLIFSRTRQFEAGEIVRFDTKVGMTSGSKVFTDIKLVTRQSEESFSARKARYQQTGERPPLKFGIINPSSVTIAGGIASKPEADWLVQEMTRALGRKI